MTQTRQDRLYEAVVEGQYKALSDVGVKTLKKYSVKFILTSLEAALSVIVSKLLDKKLRADFPDYIRYRTHTLVSISLVGHQPNTNVLSMPIESMGYEELTDFCLLRGLMLDPYHRKSIELAREAVSNAWDERRLLLRSEQSEDMGKQEEKRLLDLNKIPETQDVTTRPIQGVAPHNARKNVNLTPAEELPPLQEADDSGIR